MKRKKHSRSKCKCDSYNSEISMRQFPTSVVEELVEYIKEKKKDNDKYEKRSF